MTPQLLGAGFVQTVFDTIAFRGDAPVGRTRVQIERVTMAAPSGGRDRLLAISASDRPDLAELVPDVAGEDRRDARSPPTRASKPTRPPGGARPVRRAMALPPNSSSQPGRSSRARTSNLLVRAHGATSREFEAGAARPLAGRARLGAEARLRGDLPRGVEGVEHLEFVPDEDLAALYSASDRCSCYPSLYEGFGLPVLEAMQRAVARVTSNI